MKIAPKNWKKFQHYRQRKPPWIRLYRDILDDYEFNCLPDASIVLAMRLWLLASEYQDGVIDITLKQLTFRLRIGERELASAIKPLFERGFMIDLENASTTLATCYCDATPETETEVTEKEKGDTNVSPKRKVEKFVKPTIEEVTAYCLERKKGVNPQRWFSYYESNGWRVGKNPMKDWKAAVRTWEKDHEGETSNPPPAQPSLLPTVNGAPIRARN